MEAADGLLKIIAQLQTANDALVAAATSADESEVARLLNEIGAIERRRNRLVHKRTPGATGTASPYASSVSLRDQLIRALHVTGRPSSGRLISDVTKTRWAERVDTAKLSSLRRDELRSWRKSREMPGRVMRDVYVVPALTYDRFTPVRSTVALSTWPISTRLIAPLSPRVDMLHSTIALAREARTLTGTTYEAALRRLVGRLGATIPGISPFDAEPHAVIQAAEAELREIEETDRHERAVAAQRAQAQLEDEALLFGAQLRTAESSAAGGSR